MNAFEQLISPFTRDEFANSCWLNRAVTCRPCPSLIDPLIRDPRLLSPGRLASDGHERFRILPRKNELIRPGDGRAAMTAWERDPDVTLVAEYAQFTLESVFSYCDSLMKSIRVPFRWMWPNIYFSRSGSGFTRHWDNHENFIVGLKGKKRFFVAPNNCYAYPTQNADNYNPHVRGYEAQIETERTTPTLPGMMQIDLEPGECIFIPRGWWHEAEAIDGDSVTLTWAMWTCNWADLLAAGEFKVPESATDIALRTPVSLDSNHLPESLHFDQDESKRLATVRAQAELLSIAEVVRDWRAGFERDMSRTSEERAAQPANSGDTLYVGQ